MRDLNTKTARPSARNRMKKQKRPPIDYRGILKRVLRVAGTVLVAVLVVVAGYHLYGFVSRTTFLRVEKIEVSELKRLTREEVTGLVGVSVGDPMLSLPLRHMGEQLAKNPWVEKVSIRRHFPRTLRIELTEREPVAVVSMGYLYYLDRNGEVFKPLTQGDSLDYTVVTGVAEEELGKDPAGSREMLRKAAELIDLLAARKEFKLADISEIHVDKGFGLTVFTSRGGIPVKLGNEDIPGKLDRLARVYVELQPQMDHLAYIDLDYPDRIIVKKV